MVERMYKKGLVVGIILLFIVVGFQPAFANKVTLSIFDDDTTPPITTHSLDPSEPDGLNGYYVNDVNVTVNATDDMSGVKEIHYKVNGVEHVSGGNWTFIIYYDGNNIPVEYWAIDNAGNEENHHKFYMDIDQIKPKIIIITKVIEGNPKKGWLFRFTATCSDATSGMERVEFFLNDDLQLTAYGSGPIYEWEYRWYGNMSIEVRANAYDRAGNMDFDIAEYRDKSTNNPILNFFQSHPNLFLLLERLLDVWRFNS